MSKLAYLVYYSPYLGLNVATEPFNLGPLGSTYGLGLGFVVGVRVGNQIRTSPGGWGMPQLGLSILIRGTVGFRAKFQLVGVRVRDRATLT